MGRVLEPRFEEPTREASTPRPGRFFEVDANRVNAQYRNGLLLVSVPRSESARPRLVSVQAS